jgi:hypothetical protein
VRTAFRFLHAKSNASMQIHKELISCMSRKQDSVWYGSSNWWTMLKKTTFVQMIWKHLSHSHHYTRQPSPGSLTDCNRADHFNNGSPLKHPWQAWTQEVVITMGAKIIGWATQNHAYGILFRAPGPVWDNQQSLLEQNHICPSQQNNSKESHQRKKSWQHSSRVSW